MGQKTGLTIGLTLCVALLATADAVLVVKESPFTASTNTDTPIDQIASSSSSAQSSVELSSASSEGSTSSAPTGGVSKKTGPDVIAIAKMQDFEVTDIKEKIFLPEIIPNAEVTQQVLLLNGDRAGVIAWVDSPKVKAYFLALKEALHKSFTAGITDLVDETQRRDGKPPRNFLTFNDPGISEERIVFIRIRQRLYEMRIAQGKEEPMFKLIDELTK